MRFLSTYFRTRSGRFEDSMCVKVFRGKIRGFEDLRIRCLSTYLSEDLRMRGFGELRTRGFEDLILVSSYFRTRHSEFNILHSSFE